MRSFKLALLVAAPAIAIASGAHAADANDSDLAQSNGWYMSASLGLAFMENSSNRSGTANFDLSPSNPGFAVTGALGKELGNGFRAEGELGYRQIGMDHGTVYSTGGTGISTGPASGNANAFSVMGNGYYDFATDTPIKPYVGAGVGFARVALSEVGVGAGSAVNDSDVAFAYQAMGGVSYQLTPRGTLFTEYRYFAVDDPRFNDAAGQRVGSEFMTHNVEVGYRLAF
jgi:OOP family OmpA-OmpF porin